MDVFLSYLYTETKVGSGPIYGELRKKKKKKKTWGAEVVFLGRI